uniref:C-type lectin domain-containing protein n=1 Tax=Panagrolaimus davidi TaxID=227884 RepID=A0A914P5K9_9BILA
MLLLKALNFLFVINVVVATCPEESIPWNTQCYKFYSTSVTFPEAEETCYNFGGHLASIHDGFTNTFLGEQAQKLLNGKDFWIGAVQFRNVVWGWTDNSTFDYTNWRSGIREEHDDCGVFRINDGYWIKDFSLNYRSFVCQTLNLETSPPPNPCLDEDWYFYEPTNSCYLVSTEKYNLTDAENICINHGGHLVSIHSHEEAIFLMDIETVVYWAMWLGLHFDNQDQTWKWLDGTPTDYMPWYSNTPSKPPANYPCVSLFENEDNGEPYIDNGPCDVEQPFFCKKPVPALSWQLELIK